MDLEEKSNGAITLQLHVQRSLWCFQVSQTCSLVPCAKCILWQKIDVHANSHSRMVIRMRYCDGIVSQKDITQED